MTITDPVVFVGAQAIASAVRHSEPPIDPSDIEDLFRRSIRHRRENWMTTVDEQWFRSAAAAAMMLADDAGKEKMTKSIMVIRTMDALVSGIQIDPSAVEAAADQMDAGEVLPLLKIWHEELEKEKEG